MITVNLFSFQYRENHYRLTVQPENNSTKVIIPYGPDAELRGSGHLR